MATPSFNQNGIFLRDRVYTATSNVDSYHMYRMAQSAEPTDLGPVDIWAMAQKVQMPLYQFSNFGGKNTITVDNVRGEYKWQLPIAQDLPYIVEDIEASNEKKGIAGTTFKIKLNKRTFSHTEIISYDKFSGVELYVTDEDILKTADGYIYTVRLMNNDNTKWLDNKFLASGTYFFSKGTARSVDHGKRYADLPDVQAGFREFYSYVGGAKANASFSISNRADAIAKGALRQDGLPVIELWKHNDIKSLDPSITDLNSMENVMGKEYMKKAMQTGVLSKTFVPMLEARALSKIGNDIENYLMWGGGGYAETGGADSVRMSPGLWRQLDAGYLRPYNKNTFSIDMFKSEIFNFFNGKVDFRGPEPERQVIIQTGLGGMKLINEAISKVASNSGQVINASEIGSISGKAMDLKFGFAYTQFVIPSLANVKFVINPAFDNVHANDIENPYIDGFRLSSYSFIAFDITDNSNDNICLLKYGHDSDLQWYYINGDMDYMGRKTGFAASGDFSGYKVRMTQTYPAIHVKDPTKILKWALINPLTGGHL